MIKKIYIFIIIILSMSGCTNNKVSDNSSQNHDSSKNETLNSNTQYSEIEKDDSTSNNKKNYTNKKNNSNKSSIKENLKINSEMDNSTSPSNTSSVKYKCPKDYTLNGTMCYKYTKPRIEYECPINTTKKVDEYCIVDYSTDATITYSCGKDFKLSGDKCYKEKIVNSYNPDNYKNHSETTKSQIYNNFQKNCSNGTIKSKNGIDYCYQKETKFASISYSCSKDKGQLAGNKCILLKTEKAFAKYYCDDGAIDKELKNCVISKQAEKK